MDALHILNILRYTSLFRDMYKLNGFFLKLRKVHCMYDSNINFKRTIQWLFYRKSINLFLRIISMASLYQRLGGETSINAVTDRFYDSMIKDSRVSHYYTSIDVSKLRCRQKQFISLVTGGPSNYEGKDMKNAHCKLNISKEDFDITWQHLKEALLHFKVQKQLISEFKNIFYSVQGDIVKTSQNTRVFHDSVNKSKEVSNVSKCPFKPNLAKSSAKKENQQKCQIKLSNNVYLKWSY